MIIQLGIFIPVVFVLGIAARKPAPVINMLPAGLMPAAMSFETTVWKRAALFPKSPVMVRLLREQIGADRFAIRLSAAKDFIKPDLIVYWAATGPASTGALPTNAILLGGFSAPALTLPVDAVKADGVLILFSLADNEIVDVSTPIHFTEAIK